MIKRRHGISALLTVIAAGCIYTACNTAKAADSDDSESAFIYREVYLPESTGENAKKLGLNTIDDDWGIWGHNLRNIFPDDPSESVFAKKNGTTYRSQLCFTSPKLYEYIEDYIDSKYDSDEQIRFAILPNDNEIVCQCSRCIEAGNTKTDASAAVFELIGKLSKRFPNHIFYTSYYQSTQGLPKQRMPGNTGVLVSAINYPLSTQATLGEQKFLDVLNMWKNKTSRIVIWDYINNFDDYLTPFPVFDIMQRRLKLYADIGVTAVFLNGSGTDYSTFSDIKADVLAAMTVNPDIDWKKVMREKANEHYPTVADDIADFIIAQEDFVTATGKELPMYDGVAKAVQTYLPKDEFVKFHEKLIAKRPQVKGDERKKLDNLLGALALTRLELDRINGNVSESWRFIDDLKHLEESDIDNYNEAGWTIERYIKDYTAMMQHHEAINKKNVLQGVQLQALSPLDPEYSDISILTDGMLGIPSNYHSGNLIMSPDSYTRIAIPNDKHLKHVRVCLSFNPGYKIELPEEVTLSAGGRDIASVKPEYPKDNNGHVFVDFDVPSSATGSLVVTLYKDPDTKSMAVDEIEAW